MKRLLILLIIPFLSFGQDLTYVPDDGFELLIETLIPNASNGIENDNYVITSALDASTNTDWSGFLVINNDLSPIFDLTGIEDFKNLRGFEILNTNVYNVDLSEVTFALQEGGHPDKGLYFGGQYLETIILPEDTVTKFWMYADTNLSDIVFNPNFAFSYFFLQQLSGEICELVFEGKIIPIPKLFNYIQIGDMPGLSSIDFSAISEVPYQTYLTFDAVWELNQINLNNPVSFYNWVFQPSNTMGYNGDVCVELNSPQAVDFCSSDSSWPQESINYSTSCFNANLNCSNVNILETNSLNRALLKTIDILGTETNNKEGFQLHIYDDGSVEKKYVIK